MVLSHSRAIFSSEYADQTQNERWVRRASVLTHL